MGPSARHGYLIPTCPPPRRKIPYPPLFHHPFLAAPPRPRRPPAPLHPLPPPYSPPSTSRYPRPSLGSVNRLDFVYCKFVPRCCVRVFYGAICVLSATKLILCSWRRFGRRRLARNSCLLLRPPICCCKHVLFLGGIASIFRL